MPAMNNPYNQLQSWLMEESKLGLDNPNYVILSTCDGNNHPHARVVAIREIKDGAFIFFTQANTRKVDEIKKYPTVSLTYWLALSKKQIVIEGIAKPLTPLENSDYWETYPEVAKLRFNAYAETSSLPILSKQLLVDKKRKEDCIWKGKTIPVHPLYIGFSVSPNRFFFYHYRLDELSDVFRYQKDGVDWLFEVCSP